MKLQDIISEFKLTDTSIYPISRHNKNKFFRNRAKSKLANIFNNTSQDILLRNYSLGCINM